MTHDHTGLRTLDAGQSAALERLCEAIVPGSARVGPVYYIDALLAQMPPEHRDAVVASIERLGEVATGGPDALAEHAHSPDFLHLRALAIEAYYSDFVAPGVTAPGAWEEIGFHPPVAALLRKDWSYLGIAG
jgi:hypothetical protein